MEASSPDALRLRELEERLLQPEIHRSPTGVGELLADDFEEFGGSGRVFDKPQIIAALRDEGTTIRRSMLEFRTRILAPGVVLVTYRLARPERVVALLRIGRDAPPLAGKGDMVWVVRISHGLFGVTQEMWIGSTTGEVRTMLPLGEK